MPARSFALDRAPVEVLASLAQEPGAFAMTVPDARAPVTLLGCVPVAELRVEADHPDPLGAIARFVETAPVLDPSLPFPASGGVVGCFAYELGAWTVPGLARPVTAGPLAVLRRYDPVLVFDETRGDYTLVGSGDHPAPWLARLTEPTPSWRGPLAHAAELRPAFERDAYRAAIARIHAYLRAGDVYQVNLTQPFTLPLDAPAWALFGRIAARRPAYAAYLDLGDAQVVAGSPELLLRRRGTDLETRPIKGTRPRGGDAARDAALVAELLADPKERAEHVMIVDLERNDLGRVAVPGSVEVARHAAVETHPTLHHLVSVVRARLRPDVGWRELLAATFPGGSVTGAPKRRAMEIIAELERGQRGVYTGAIGVLDPRGHCELGLPIRTGVVRDGVLRYHAGGGIVVDSDADRELDECWLKTAALRAALADAGTALDRCSSG